LASCALLGLGVGACASDDEGSSFKAGVDGNTNLGDLTPDQQVTLCHNQAAYVKTHVDTTALTRFVCAFSPGVILAASDAACESALEGCVNAFAVKLDIGISASPTNAQQVCVTVPQDQLAQCQGTVSDYENCVDSIANVSLTIGTDFSCGKRANYDQSPTIGVDACAAVGPACTPATQVVR
jgi:hypothetical protein